MEALEKPEELAEEITADTLPEEIVPEALPEENVTAADSAVSAEEYSRKAYEEAYEKLYTEILEHFRSFSPSEQIAGRITEEHITEYLEGNHEERLREYKERREKRILNALELIAVLVAIVLVVWFLGDNPAILVNILYIVGGLGAFFIWKHPHNKNDKKE